MPLTRGTTHRLRRLVDLHSQYLLKALVVALPRPSSRPLHSIPPLHPPPQQGVKHPDLHQRIPKAQLSNKHQRAILSTGVLSGT